MTRLSAALALLATLLAACAAGGGSGDESSELEFVLFGGPEEVAGYEQVVDDFEADNTDLEVTLSPVATQDELLARLSTGFSGGTPPDVFLINFRKYGQFAAEGGIEPVGPYLAGSDELAEDDFAPEPLDVFRFDGNELTCLPQNVSSLVTYYNEDLFAERGVSPPRDGWTWDDFLDAAQQLTGDGTYGVGFPAKVIRLAPFVWSNGGDVVDDTEDPSRLTVTEGPAREALDFFLDLSLVHEVVPPDREEQSEDAESRFIRGNLGMYLSSRVATPTLRTIDGFDWDVAPLPVAPGGEPVTMLHSDAYCLSAGTGRADDAWRFVEFAESRAGQRILTETGRLVPSRTDVAASDVFLEPDEPPASSEVFVDNVEVARATPTVSSWARVEKAADDLLEAIFYGRIDRDDGIERLVTETAPLFDAGAGP